MEPILARLYFIQIPEVGKGPSASFPGSFENRWIGIVDFVHDLATLIAGSERGSIRRFVSGGLSISLLYHERYWAPNYSLMRRQPAKSPVVIDLVDSDSDIEIIHHAIVVFDDEAPSRPGPSRPTTQRVSTPHT